MCPDQPALDGERGAYSRRACMSGARRQIALARRGKDARRNEVEGRPNEADSRLLDFSLDLELSSLCRREYD